MSEIDISKLNSTSRPADAKAKALEFARAFKDATPVKEPPRLDNSAIKHQLLIQKAVEAIEMLPDSRRVQFMYVLAREFGGIEVFETIPEYEIVQTGIRLTRVVKLQDGSPKYVMDRREPAQWTDLIGMNWIYQRGIHLPADLVLVVPISVSFDIDADTHTYNWALFTDRSHAKGTENYVDVYVSSEVGFKFPLSKIVSFDIKSGAKIGEKHYKRDEVRQSSRVGETTSRAYIIRKIGRNCLLYSRGLINMGVVNLFSLQTGYRLEQKDSGNVLGSWWNAFDLGANQVESGYFEAGTAMERAVDVYSLEMAKRRTNWPSR